MEISVDFGLAGPESLDPNSFSDNVGRHLPAVESGWRSAGKKAHLLRSRQDNRLADEGVGWRLLEAGHPRQGDHSISSRHDKLSLLLATFPDERQFKRLVARQGSST